MKFLFFVFIDSEECCNILHFKKQWFQIIHVHELAALWFDLSWQNFERYFQSGISVHFFLLMVLHLYLFYCTSSHMYFVIWFVLHFFIISNVIFFSPPALPVLVIVVYVVVAYAGLGWDFFQDESSGTLQAIYGDVHGNGDM